MKRLLIALLLPCAAFVPARAQNIEGQIIASQYGAWRVQGYAANDYTFAPTSCRVQGGASFFSAFTSGVPVEIVDGNPALSEEVTPSSVVINNQTCSISISPQNSHQLPWYIHSATGGLQEALNQNLSSSTENTVVLDSLWYQVGGSSSVIARVRGAAKLGLVDVTKTPFIWYSWNGSQYVVDPTGAVSSVFGRTGAVVAQAGDYNCDQVTDCGTAPAPGWYGTLTAAQGSGDSTLYVNVGGGALPGSGYYFVDAEWEHFAEYTALGGGNYTLTGVTRGQFSTAKAAHGAGASANSMQQLLSSTDELPFAWVGGPEGQSFIAINCPFGTNQNAEVEFEVGCPLSGGFFLFTNHTFVAGASAQNLIRGSLAIGVPAFTPNSLDQTYAISHTSEVLQSGYPNQVTGAIGFANGIPDSVRAVQPPNAAGPILIPSFVPPGSTTYTYLCQGTDVFGNNIPGTPASVTNLAASGWGGSAFIQGYCGPIPGAASVTVYRTAGGPNTGILATGTGAELAFQDFYTTASTGTPNVTNTTEPVLCTNGTQFCEESGTSATPPTNCSNSTQGWVYHMTSAAASPFAKVCNGSSWVTAY